MVFVFLVSGTLKKSFLDSTRTHLPVMDVILFGIYISVIFFRLKILVMTYIGT